MSQQQLSNRLLAGAVTFVGLGCVWIAIVGNLPSEQELSARESPQSSLLSASARPIPEPVLDLSIPGVPAPRPSADITASPVGQPPAATASERHAAQVARLRCEAEVEQACPETADGSGRRQCLETHTQRLPLACQQQVKERLARWKEARSRLVLACQADVRRFCSHVRPGGGPELQCLQQHAQELSDGCYAMLPKGTLYVKQ